MQLCYTTDVLNIHFKGIALQQLLHYRRLTGTRTAAAAAAAPRHGVMKESKTCTEMCGNSFSSCCITQGSLEAYLQK